MNQIAPYTHVYMSTEQQLSSESPSTTPRNASETHSYSSMPPSDYSFDTSGQLAPPGMKPRVTATPWEDEGSLCFQVEANGVCVARREDNHMINGTKLLNVAGVTRGRRDGILKSEKTRHVVKIGPMHLKGVWIPFDRALDFANKEKITEQLYPLFVHDIGALLYHPSNQSRPGMSNSSALAAMDRRRSDNPPSLHHAALNPPVVSHSPSLYKTPNASADIGGPTGGGSYPFFSIKRSKFVSENQNSSIDDCSTPQENSTGVTKSSLENASRFSSTQESRIAKIGKFHAHSTDTETSSDGSNLDSSLESSEYSADEEPDLLSPIEQKLSLVNRLMGHFYLLFRLRTSTGNGSTAANDRKNSGSAINVGQSSSTVRNSGSKSTISRKRGRVVEDEKGCDSDGETGGNQRRKCPKAQDKDDELSANHENLACPYFKRNPHKYRGMTSCPGPGWKTVHRMKEHLYRRHALPLQCNRCRGKFSNDDELQEHQRALVPCEMGQLEPAEGFTPGQEKQLRSRKRSKPNMTEVEKWYQAYTILFPENDQRDMPTPFYELSSSSTDDLLATSANDLARYQLFVQDQMPRQVRQQLIIAVERELEPVEERLRIQLHDIVRIVHREMLQSFQQSLQSLSPTAAQITTAAVTSVIGIEAQYEAEQSAFQLTAEDDLLGMWWDHTLASNSSFDMGQSGFPSDLPTATSDGFFSDSGYGAMSSSATPMMSNCPPYDSTRGAAKAPPDTNEAGVGSPCTVRDEDEDES